MPECSIDIGSAPAALRQDWQTRLAKDAVRKCSIGSAAFPVNDFGSSNLKKARGKNRGGVMAQYLAGTEELYVTVVLTKALRRAPPSAFAFQVKIIGEPFFVSL